MIDLINSYVWSIKKYLLSICTNNRTDIDLKVARCNQRANAANIAALFAYSHIPHTKHELFY